MAKKRKTRRKTKTKRRKNPKRVKAGKKAARSRKRGSKSRKKNKSSKKTKNRKMAGRKGISKITSNPILRKVLLAAGVVAVATSVAQIVAPSLVPTLQRPIVRAGLGFVTGDFVGAISNFVIGGGGLGSLTGGNGPTNAVAQSQAGFA